MNFRSLTPVWSFLPLLLAAVPAAAQPVFNDVTPTANSFFVTPEDEDFWLNALAPADADGDGDLDFAAIGYYVVYNESVVHHLLLFRNDGPDGTGHWNFTTIELPLGAFGAGASDLVWGDYDGDGDDDLTVGSNGATVIYRNAGGTLTPLPNELPGYYEDASFSQGYDLRSLSWADYDNDGDLDLLIPSAWDDVNGQFYSALVRNDGADGSGGWSFVPVLDAGIDPAAHAQTAWADEDGDGDLDLLLLNIAFNGENSYLRLYRNQGGSFTAEPMLDFADLDGMVDWADADADGDLDILVVGNLRESDGTYDTVLRIYRNEGSGVFQPITVATGWNGTWLDLFAATWADYDSDGDVDILATGSFIGAQEIEGQSRVYTNTGNTWTMLPLQLPAPISSVGRGGAFTWLDLDNDGDLDYMVGGAYFIPGGNGLVEAKIKLYANGAAALNQRPSAPQGVVAAAAAGGVELTWNPATDDHTAAAALTYDLDIRRQGTPAVAARLLPQPGNLSRADGWRLELPPGTYTYSLCAVDSALNPGPKTTGTFTVGAAPNIFADGFETGTTGRWFSAVP